MFSQIIITFGLVALGTAMPQDFQRVNTDAADTEGVVELVAAFLPKLTQTLTDPATNAVEKNKQFTLSFLPLARQVSGVLVLLLSYVMLCTYLPMRFMLT